MDVFEYFYVAVSGRARFHFQKCNGDTWCVFAIGCAFELGLALVWTVKDAVMCSAD